MKLGGWPRPPIVLGFVLGKIMEEAMNLSMQVHAWGSFTRPIVLVVITLIILTIILAVRKQKKKKAEQAERLSAQDAADEAAPTIPMVVEEGGKNCPPASWPISALLVALFLYCFVDAMQWSFGSRIFPQTVATAGFLLAFGALLFDLKGRAALKAGTAASDVVGVDESLCVEEPVLPILAYRNIRSHIGHWTVSGPGPVRHPLFKVLGKFRLESNSLLYDWRDRIPSHHVQRDRTSDVV